MPDPSPAPPPAVQSPPPSPRGLPSTAPDPRSQLMQMVHTLAHRRDARVLSDFLRLRGAMRR